MTTENDREIIKTFENKDGNSSSRYSDMRILRNNDGVEFLETWRGMEIPKHENDSYYKVKAGMRNRLDLLAYEYYNSAQLWWVIAVANDISNPLELDPGQILRIPAMETLYGFKGILT